MILEFNLLKFLRPFNLTFLHTIHDDPDKQVHNHHRTYQDKTRKIEEGPDRYNLPIST